MTGPFKVLYATLETITVEQNGEEVTLSNDGCIHDIEREAIDSDRQDDITDTSFTNNNNHNQTPIDDGREKDAREEDVLHSDTDDKHIFPTYRVPTRAKVAVPLRRSKIKKRSFLRISWLHHRLSD